MTTIESPKAFVERISAATLKSTSVHHAYLEAFKRAQFPNFELALKDFALEYGVYSRGFISYLHALLENMSDRNHIALVKENLSEELGDTHGVDLPLDVLASISDQPHAKLFERFQKAIGVDHRKDPREDHAGAGSVWRKNFLSLCRTDQCTAVGAIGIGTELIVHSVYAQILEAMESHTNLSRIDRVFFDLHAQCDEEHAEQMCNIAIDLAVTKEAQIKIEYGVNHAIRLRSEFWDTMLERAMAMPAWTDSKARLG